MQPHEIEHRFDSVQVEGAEAERVDQLREIFKRAGQEIVALTPDGRYESLAMTALEESAMWAVKAVTHPAVPPVTRSDR